MNKNLDETQVELLKKALIDAKIHEVLLDRLIENMFLCNSCENGCSMCCQTGEANR